VSLDLSKQCHSCQTIIAQARDRFCVTCGAQLMRPDLRPAAGGVAAPVVFAPLAPAAVAARSSGGLALVSVVAMCVMIALTGVAVAVIVAVTSGGDAPAQVTDPNQTTVVTIIREATP